jgi:hypothetical protein
VVINVVSQRLRVRYLWNIALYFSGRYITSVVDTVSKNNQTCDAAVMLQASNMKPVNRNVLNGNDG